MSWARGQERTCGKINLNKRHNRSSEFMRGSAPSCKEFKFTEAGEGERIKRNAVARKSIGERGVRKVITRVSRRQQARDEKHIRRNIHKDTSYTKQCITHLHSHPHPLSTVNHYTLWIHLAHYLMKRNKIAMPLIQRETDRNRQRERE